MFRLRNPLQLRAQRRRLRPLPPLPQKLPQVRPFIRISPYVVGKFTWIVGRLRSTHCRVLWNYADLNPI